MPPRQRFSKDATKARRLDLVVVEKPWGRTDIPAAFGNFGDRRIGEIWLVHPDGDAAPLMVKFLFTSERLSVQVHPDETAAQAAGLRSGKDECWLVLAADEGAEMGVGLTAPSDANKLRAAALDGSIAAMVDWRATKVDDFIYNPAGTIHALGAGLTIVEVQQNLDLTYRLYDYGRPRELHLEQGLKVANPGPVADPRDCSVSPSTSQKLVSGPHFHVLHLASPFDPADVVHAKSELTFVPLSTGCHAAGESLRLGEVVLLDDPRLIDMAPGSRALLCWAD